MNLETPLPLHFEIFWGAPPQTLNLIGACSLYFDDDEKEGLAVLTALLQKPCTPTRAKYNARRNAKGLCDPRDKHLERGAGYVTFQQHIMTGAEPLGSYAPRFILMHSRLIWSLVHFDLLFFTESTLRADCPLGFNSAARPPSHRMSADWPST